MSVRNTTSAAASSNQLLAPPTPSASETPVSINVTNADPTSPPSPNIKDDTRRGTMKDAPRTRRQTMRRSTNLSVESNGDSAASALASLRSHEQTLGQQIAAQGRSGETTEQRFLRLLKEKKQLELAYEEEKQQRAALNLQLQSVNAEYRDYKATIQAEKQLLLDQHKQQLLEMSEQHKSTMEKLQHDQKSELRQRLVERDAEYKASEERQVRLQSLTSNEIERELYEKISVTLNERFEKQRQKQAEEYEQQLQQLQYVQHDLETAREKIQSLEDVRHQLLDENTKLQAQAVRRDQMLREYAGMKVECRRYRLLLRYMTISRYCKEWKLRQALVNLHRDITALVELLIGSLNESERSQLMQQQNELSVWLHQAQRLVAQFQQQKESKNRRQTQSKLTNNSNNSNITSSHGSRTLPSAPMTAAHARRYSIASFEAEQRLRTENKQRVIAEYNNQHSSRLITHLTDVESALRLSLHSILQQAHHWKSTSDSFFQRTTELTNLCIQHEKQCVKLQARVQKYKTVYLELRQAYAVVCGRERRLSVQDHHNAQAAQAAAAASKTAANGHHPSKSPPQVRTSHEDSPQLAGPQSPRQQMLQRRLDNVTVSDDESADGLFSNPSSYDGSPSPPVLGASLTHSAKQRAVQKVFEANQAASNNNSSNIQVPLKIRSNGSDKRVTTQNKRPTIALKPVVSQATARKDTNRSLTNSVDKPRAATNGKPRRNSLTYHPPTAEDFGLDDRLPGSELTQKLQLMTPPPSHSKLRIGETHSSNGPRSPTTSKYAINVQQAARQELNMISVPSRITPTNQLAHHVLARAASPQPNGVIKRNSFVMLQALDKSNTSAGSSR